MRTLTSNPRAHRFLALAALALMALATGCDWKVSQTESTASGDEIFELCVSCHGNNGQGNKTFNAPSIAGLPQWYIESQLTKFRTGVRGTHPEDITGLQMRPMAISFHNDADIKAVASYVTSLPRPAAAPLLTGDAAKGQASYAPCTACHGVDGAGNEQLKAPPLKNASDWYLVAQLKKFKDGHRGANPADLEGAQMRPMAAMLVDEQAMQDVVAYIMTLK
jgi:cytochrome c oxidase subunit 2